VYTLYCTVLLVISIVLIVYLHAMVCCLGVAVTMGFTDSPHIDTENIGIMCGVWCMVYYILLYYTTIYHTILYCMVYCTILYYNVWCICVCSIEYLYSAAYGTRVDISIYVYMYSVI
jgi:hypothetical protein